MNPIEHLVRIEKPANILDLGEVDVAALKTIVSKTSEAVWQRENAGKENNFACFHHTQHIIFRFIEGMRDHRESYSTQMWPMWQPVLMPIMQKAIEPYGFKQPEFPKAMLARLMAGYAIDPHYDGAGSNLHTHKIHVPLFTNADAMFHIDGDEFHLTEGRAFEVNNIKRHGVNNGGTDPRIHFIFEVFDAANDA